MKRRSIFPNKEPPHRKMQGKVKEGKARQGKRKGKSNRKETLLVNNNLSKFPTYSTNNLL